MDATLKLNIDGDPQAHSQPASPNSSAFGRVVAYFEVLHIAGSVRSRL